MIHKGTDLAVYIGENSFSYAKEDLKDLYYLNGLWKSLSPQIFQLKN